MLELDPQLTALLAVVACAVAGALAVALLLVALRLRSLRHRHERAFGGADGEQVVELLGQHADGLRSLRGELGELELQAAQLRDRVRGTVSKVGLVRYDAFEDMGGALSFSAALLDEHGDGIVLSAINGRSETRCYAKPIAAAASEHNLSGEERAAVDAAISGEQATATATPVPGRRRRRTS